MSKCCKYAKWWPHNWLCLKGLSILFTVLFYLAFAFAIFMLCQIIPAFFHPQFPKSTAAILLVIYVGGSALAASLFLAIAKLTKAVAKIKHAVAPCCCEKDAKEEKPAKKENKKAVAKEEKSK